MVSPRATALWISWTSRSGTGNSLGLKSPTVRLQTSFPFRLHRAHVGGDGEDPGPLETVDDLGDGALAGCLGVVAEYCGDIDGHGTP